jgi:hypothetical protein
MASQDTNRPLLSGVERKALEETAETWLLSGLMHHVHQTIVAPKAKDDPSGQSLVTRASMTRRSWYVDKQAADGLAAAIDHIHQTTSAPKHIITSALFRAAIAQAEGVAEQLRSEPGEPHDGNGRSLNPGS